MNQSKAEHPNIGAGLYSSHPFSFLQTRFFAIFKQKQIAILCVREKLEAIFGKAIFLFFHLEIE
jgi:hypothetical protein